MEAAQIEEIEEGVDYGVRSVEASKLADEKFLRGVRICRDCQHYLRRKQYILEARTTPLIVTLHTALVSLEEEIEISLRTLEETLTQHSADQIGANNASFAEARQHSTALFADYEAIAKRLIAIPCPGGSGSSQDRIQRAITMHANLFLQKRVFLKALSRQALVVEKQAAEPMADVDSELARKLQPLLEQEVVLESFIEDARAQRRFDDVKTLVLNLKEIRDEIDNLSRGAS